MSILPGTGYVCMYMFIYIKVYSLCMYIFVFIYIRKYFIYIDTYIYLYTYTSRFSLKIDDLNVTYFGDRVVLSCSSENYENNHIIIDLDNFYAGSIDYVIVNQPDTYSAGTYDTNQPYMYCMSGVSCLRLSSCIHALLCSLLICLRGWVYAFYVGHIDKIMKPFSML
jgi:hypothetical protein